MVGNLQQATIGIKDIKPPAAGKTQFTVVTADSQVFGIFPDKKDQIAIGGTYDISYESRDFNGKTFKTIKSAKVKSAPVAGTPAASFNTYRRTDDQDAERMLTTSLMHAFIRAGMIDLQTTSIATAINVIRGVWPLTFGRKDTKAQTEEALNDEIPYNL